MKFVLCTPTQILYPNGTYSEIRKISLEESAKILLDYGVFIEWSRNNRSIEKNNIYQQSVVQIVFRYKNLFFTNIQEKGDPRLEEMRQLIGGHIVDEDLKENENAVNVIFYAIKRNINEEVLINTKIIDIEYLGLIHVSDGHQINDVHTGAVFIIELDKPFIECKQKEDVFVKNGKFITLEDSLNYNLNYWTRYIFEYLSQKDYPREKINLSNFLEIFNS